MPAPAEYQSGYIEYDGRYYGFSSPRTKNAFKRNPEHYLGSLTECLKKSPDLVYLLGLGKVLPGSISISSTGTIKVERVSMEMQTDTHPIESYIDHQYEFSEWKLRQHALKIADLRNRRTHSTQTHISRFRKEQQTQVYLPKEVSTQTGIEKGINPIKSVRYIRGLRGDPNSKMSIVNMTFERP